MGLFAFPARRRQVLDTSPGPGPGWMSASRVGRWALACGLCGSGYIVTATFLVAIVRAGPEIRPVEPVVRAVVGVAAAPSVAAWARAGRRGPAPRLRAADGQLRCRADRRTGARGLPARPVRGVVLPSLLAAGALVAAAGLVAGVRVAVAVAGGAPAAARRPAG
jgi:hypothetical protein